METNRLKKIIPFKATHPGVILGEELKERGISQKDFAQQIGFQGSNLNDVIKGKRNINAQLAIKLEQALGISRETWLRLQASYDCDVIAISQRDNEEQRAMEYEQSCSQIVNLEILYKRLCLTSKNMNARDRIRRLEEMLHVDDLLNLFRQNELVCGMYKHSEKLFVEDRNMKAWLALSWHAIQADSLCQGYQKGNALLAAQEIAKMANEGTLSKAALKDCLSRQGITYLHVEKVEKAPIDAYSTIKDGHPIIVVTYRHNDIDKLAFDVLHELCHIDRHINDTESAFISVDGAEYANDYREAEANKFAESMLISDEVWAKILGTSTISLNPHKIIEVVAKRAKDFNISQSIAVARYKHKENWYGTKRYRAKKIEQKK